MIHWLPTEEAVAEWGWHWCVRMKIGGGQQDKVQLCTSRNDANLFLWWLPALIQGNPEEYGNVTSAKVTYEESYNVWLN